MYSVILLVQLSFVLNLIHNIHIPAIQAPDFKGYKLEFGSQQMDFNPYRLDLCIIKKNLFTFSLQSSIFMLKITNK